VYKLINDLFRMQEFLLAFMPFYGHPME